MTYDLKVDRLIDATPEEAYAAFTDADAMREWYVDQPGWIVEVEACDVRVGGTTIVSFGPPSGAFREDMTYEVVEPPSRLVYTEVFRQPDGASHTTRVEVTFEPSDGKTRMTVVQTGFADEGMRDAHSGGWPHFLERLERVATSRRVG